MSEATQSSLIPVSSSALCSRLASRARLVAHDGPPEHPGRFHHDLRDPERRQPVRQRQQARDCGRELRDVLLTRAVLRGHPHARRDLLLMNIQRRRTLNYRLHSASQNPIDKIVAQGPLRTNESDKRALGNSPEPRGDSHAKLSSGTLAPRAGSASRATPGINPFSSARDRPPGQHN
jgi:hypothetical protein